MFKDLRVCGGIYLMAWLGSIMNYFHLWKKMLYWIHYTFIPLTNEKLDAWRQTNSKTRVWTIQTSPLRLWVAGQINFSLDDMSRRELRNFGVEDILTNKEAHERPIITSPADNILTHIVVNSTKCWGPIWIITWILQNQNFYQGERNYSSIHMIFHL